MPNELLELIKTDTGKTIGAIILFVGFIDITVVRMIFNNQAKQLENKIAASTSSEELASSKQSLKGLRYVITIITCISALFIIAGAATLIMHYYL